MLELLCLFAMLVAFKIYPLDKGQARESARADDRDGQDEQRTLLQPRMHMVIEGTQRFALERRGVVHGFGIDPRAVLDLRVFHGAGVLDELPATVADTVRTLHASGGALGADIVDLLFHARALKHDEAVYFALVRSAAGNARVVTFLDRLHQ